MSNEMTFSEVDKNFKEKEDEILLKHVNAIALMPVKGGKKISLMGRRLFNVLLHRSMNEPEKAEHEVSLFEIINTADSKTTNYEQIKKALKELMTTTVEWQSPSKNEFVDIWDACNLLSGVSLMKNKKTGSVTVKWRFDCKIRENILRPEIYSRLSIESITQFSTHPAMALYEICARYVNNPSHLTSRQNWKTWWRPVLTGVAADPEKAEYRFFNRDVLKKAVAEVNAKSNLQIIGPIEFKGSDNRTVIDIQFEVHYKKNTGNAMAKKPLINTKEEELPVIGRAINCGVTQKEIEKLFTLYSLDSISHGIDELEKRLGMPKEKICEVEKPGLWLKAVLKRIDAQSQGMAITSVGIEKQRKEWVQNWLKIVKEKLIYAFEDASKEEQQEIRQEFEAHLIATDQKILLEKLREVNLHHESKSDNLYYWNFRMLKATFISFLGVKYLGPNWDKPTADDLLAHAAKEASEK